MSKRPYHSSLNPRPQATNRDILSQQLGGAPSGPPRDRYRASRFDHPTYDVVEDDEGNGRIVYDAFDQYLLEQPIQDRQQQAAQGKACLSLAPDTSRFVARSVASPAAQNYYARDYDQQGGEEYHYEEASGKHLSQYAFNPTAHSTVCSEQQVGASSSPALQAARRHPEQLRTHKRVHRSPLIDESTRPNIHSLENTAFLRPDLSKTFNRNHELEEEIPRDMLQDKHIAQVKPHGFVPRAAPKTIEAGYTPPIIQGICLVPVTALPDRLRTVFPFPNFNAVQSKCFKKVFETDDNFVLASPTGSGKTAILELAVCRAVLSNTTGQYKIVYQAPTKALCSERQRDWDAKFTQIGLKCVELTGDSEASDLRNVQSANIIITTPEKWDCITRKWKDHERLMKLIKLFLIDEVHILKDDRGAVLEAVVSRMKSVGDNVRFVALSATVPNLEDVATWLGLNCAYTSQPALMEQFGQEFRPVQLTKHVCGFPFNGSNEFAFESMLDKQIPFVIGKYSERKPIMVFCATRASTVKTAKLIAGWWASKSNREHYWKRPTTSPRVADRDLCETLSSGVAFHHAGIDLDDRLFVENGYLNGEINVICCTSTLAVGVNLPCHLVIIKNTSVWTNEGLQEYSDLEMMQMLGRAGRPQFDDSAVAVIMTRQHKVNRYEIMVNGQELLESKLHLNLIDHMNAEIGLGTIRDMETARKWLKGTFLYVRLQQNPDYYKLDGSTYGQTVEEQVDNICERDIALLRDTDLVTGDRFIRCTDFGDAMARYYVHFDTMKCFMSLRHKSIPSEILSAIAQASEFSMIRFRQGEKPFYKKLNKSSSIRWPIPVNLDLPAQKVSLIIQSVLGSVDLVWEGDMAKHKSQFQTETQIIFKYINSLIRCIVDCQISLGDSISIHSALMLERSLGSQAWDDSPLQMRLVENIGPVAVRKLVNAGIRSVEDLEACDAQRIETLVGRNPPFGLTVLNNVKKYPKLRLSVHLQKNTIKKAGDGVEIRVKVDIGFLNDKPPKQFANRPVYVCLLAETSDGRKIHFARISGSNLGNGQSQMFPALLTEADQSINCYVMCDGIAGSMRSVSVKPQISSLMFTIPPPRPPPSLPEPAGPHQPNISRRRNESVRSDGRLSANSEDFDDDVLDDELMRASIDDLRFDHIDNYPNPLDVATRKNTAANSTTGRKNKGNSIAPGHDPAVHEPQQLPNGKWACNHKCKDKTACKHTCCKEGLDKPPKKPASKDVSSVEPAPKVTQKMESQKGKQMQTKLQLSPLKRSLSNNIETLDLTQLPKKHKTHPGVHSGKPEKTSESSGDFNRYSSSARMPSTQLTYPSQPQSHGYNAKIRTRKSSYGDEFYNDFGDEIFDELHYSTEEHNSYGPSRINQHVPEAMHDSDIYGDDDSLLGDAMVGLADSQVLQSATRDGDRGQHATCNPTLAPEDDRFFIAEDPDRDIDPTDTYNSFPLPTQGPERTASKHVPTMTPPALSDDSDMHLRYQSVEHVTDYNATNTMARKDNINFRSDQNVENQEIPTEVDTPDAFKDLEPWLFQEFGDIVELIDE